MSTTSFDTITQANHRHDQQHGDPWLWARVKSGWREERMLRRGPLTDRQIERYAAAGWYGPEAKAARAGKTKPKRKDER